MKSISKPKKIKIKIKLRKENGTENRHHHSLN